METGTIGIMITVVDMTEGMTVIEGGTVDMIVVTMIDMIVITVAIVTIETTNPL